MLYGKWARGATHLVVIGVTFGLGLALHSSVAWPVWSIRSPSFNLINNFTFITQMGGGLPAIASFIASSDPGIVADSLLGRFVGQPSHFNYELGSYFLIIAGALNYFAVGNFYDRFIHPRMTLPQSGESQTAKEA